MKEFGFTIRYTESEWEIIKLLGRLSTQVSVDGIPFSKSIAYSGTCALRRTFEWGSSLKMLKGVLCPDVRPDTWVEAMDRPAEGGESPTKKSRTQIATTSISIEVK